MPRTSQHIACLILVALTALAAQARAQDALRAWGLTGSCAARADGLEAVGRNPALLADPAGGGLSFGLISLGVDLDNNGLSLSRYNEISGAELDESEKEALLAELPDEGLRLNAGLEGTILGLRYGRFALSTQLTGAAGGNIDRDVFELVLLGNEIDEAFTFDDTQAEGHALAAVVASYAHPIRTREHSQLSAGVNLRYLHGFYEFRTEEITGGLTTRVDGLEGSARAELLTARGGSGYAADLGLALRMDERWRMGLVWENVLAGMTWDREVEHRLWTAQTERLALGADDYEDAVVEEDSTWTGDPYTGDLPSSLRLGVLREARRVSLAAETEIRLSSLKGASTGPTMMVGGEWKALSWLRPRLGLGFGSGAKGTVGGLGLRFAFFRADLFAGTRGGYLPGGTHGLALGSAFSLDF